MYLRREGTGGSEVTVVRGAPIWTRQSAFSALVDLVMKITPPSVWNCSFMSFCQWRRKSINIIRAYLHSPPHWSIILRSLLTLTLTEYTTALGIPFSLVHVQKNFATSFPLASTTTVCSCCTFLSAASNVPNRSFGCTTTYSRIRSSLSKCSVGSVDLSSKLKHQYNRKGRKGMIISQRYFIF